MPPEILRNVQLVALHDGLDENLVDRLGGSGPVRRFRREAWTRFEETPFPFRTDEDWRRTDLARFDFSNCPPDREAGLSFPEGVGVMPLTDALARDAGLTGCLSRSADRVEKKFGALNDALFGPGLCVRVPAGARMEEPVRLRTQVRGGTTCFPRTLVVVEGNARATVVDELSGVGDEQGLCLSQVDLHVEPGAVLRYVRIQRLPLSVVQVESVFSRTGRDGRCELAYVDTGGRLVKKFVEMNLPVPGGHAQVRGIGVVRKRQHFDVAVNVNHTAPHATSHVFCKNALRDRARAVFTGTIRVAREARKTDSYEKNVNLLLSRGARADTIPRLEILADDVRCGHGAAVGTLEKEPLYYAMSRGLSRAEAEKLIVDGFFEEILAAVRVPEEIRDRMRGLVHSALEIDHGPEEDRKTR